MIYLFKIDAPGNDLDGETFVLQSANIDEATSRAASLVDKTLCYAHDETRRSSRAVYLGSFKSREAYLKARDLAFDNGEALPWHAEGAP